MADIDEILDHGTPDYCSPTHSAQMYKDGTVSFNDVESSMKSALDYYMRGTCLELLEYMAKNNILCEVNIAKEKRFYFKGQWLSKEELFENFL